MILYSVGSMIFFSFCEQCSGEGKIGSLDMVMMGLTVFLACSVSFLSLWKLKIKLFFKVFLAPIFVVVSLLAILFGVSAIFKL